MEIIYEIVYFKEALNDIEHWKKSGDKQALKKIDKILDALETEPYSKSPGEPERLKYSDAYSRRINKNTELLTK